MIDPNGLTEKTQALEKYGRDLTDLARRLAERKIALELSPAAKELIAKEGFDPVYGARPIRPGGRAGAGGAAYELRPGCVDH